MIKPVKNALASRTVYPMTAIVIVKITDKIAEIFNL
jgi:hypothetical protein